MPNWKKVIVSGSNAVLNQITASGAIVSTNANSNLSGSFSGSFTGDGSGLTGVTATTPTLQQVTDQGATTTNDIQITGSLTISGSFHAFTLDSDNIVLGAGAGASMAAGADNNVILGTAAGNSLITGDNNTLIGSGSGGSLTTTSQNTFIGASSGHQNTGQYNVAVGQSAARYGNGTTSQYNVAIGRSTLQGRNSSSQPSYTVAIGAFAGFQNNNGIRNTFIGYYAGRGNASSAANGDNNVGIGPNTLYNFGVAANNNIAIGQDTGYNVVEGANNILIGSGSYGTNDISNQLKIGNQLSPIISGSLSTQDVIFYNTASAPNFSGSFQGDGSGLTNVPAASGKFGISNSSGEFTYYTTLTLAVAAASSGDVVQMFANVEETGAVEVVVPDGVHIDGNGYTYTLNNAGTESALAYTSAASTTNYLTNIRIVRKGGTQSNINSLCILIGASNNSKKLHGDGVRLESDFGTCLGTTGAGGRFDEVTGIVGEGIQGAYWTYGRLKNCDFKGTTSYGIQVRNGAEAIECKGESTSNYGIYFVNGLQTSTTCIGISDSSIGIFTGVDIRDCTGESNSGNGIQISGTVTLTNCTGRSSSSNGIFTSSTSEIIDCTGISVSGPGIFLRNNNKGTAHNCVAYSSTSTTGALRFQDGGTITNSSIFHEGSSGGNQHAVYTSGTNQVTIIGCDITANDPSSNAVYAASSGANTLLQDNVYKGMTTALSANVTQVAVSVADTYGNTHVTSSVPYNYDFTTATAISGSTFSGSFVGDGSGLTGITSTAGSTAGRVVFTTTNGELTTESGFEYDTSTNQLSVDSLNVIHLTSSFITASRVHTSGSNIFGDDTTDTQTLIGTTKMTGSAQVTGSLDVTGTGTILDDAAIGIAAASARLHVKGAGSSAATTTFLVERANGNDIFRIKDDKSIALLGASTFYDGIEIDTGDISGSSTSTASFGTYIGDGSQLTGISAGTDLTQSLFVSPSGDNSTAVVGDITKPFQTILAATASANIGDTIFIYPGIYEPSSQILKDRINYYFYPGAIVSGSSTLMEGTFEKINVRGYGVFDVNGNISPLNITANGYFECDKVLSNGLSSAGSANVTTTFGQNSSYDSNGILEVKGQFNVTGSGNGFNGTVRFGNGNIVADIKAFSDTTSANDGIIIGSATADLVLNAYSVNKKGSALYSTARITHARVTGHYESVDESNYYAILMDDGYIQNGSFDCEIIGAIKFEPGGIASNFIQVDGYQRCTNSPSSLGAIQLTLGGRFLFKHGIEASETIFYLNHAQVEAAFEGNANIISDNSGKLFDISAGKLVWNGNSNDINARVTSNEISGGELIINSPLRYAGKEANSNREVFNLSGGTLEINNKIIYHNNLTGSGIVDMTGGYLKLNGAQLINGEATGSMAYAIKLNGSAHSGSILNNSFTNLTPFGPGSFTNEITGGGTLFYSDKLY